MLAHETDSGLKKNILKFGYGINYKYDGQLSHSIDCFYVVTEFQLPKPSYIPKKKPGYYNKCEHLSP